MFCPAGHLSASCEAGFASLSSLEASEAADGSLVAFPQVGISKLERLLEGDQTVQGQFNAGEYMTLYT